MQKLLATGKVRNIGVSNFQIRHLDKLLNDPSCKIIPAVNQIEVSSSLMFLSDPNKKRSVLTCKYSCIPTTHRKL